MRKFVFALAIFAGLAAPMVVSSANAGTCYMTYVGHTPVWHCS
jgi:hypothetical protein